MGEGEGREELGKGKEFGRGGNEREWKDFEDEYFEPMSMKSTSTESQRKSPPVHDNAKRESSLGRE